MSSTQATGVPSRILDKQDASPVRLNLSFRLESALLLSACVFIGFVWPMLMRSPFDGVWFRTGGDANAPSEIKLLAHRGKFSEVLPVDCFGSYESVTLIADGRQHAWSEPAGNCHLAFERGIASYSAELTRNALTLTKSTGAATFTESWQILDSRHMVVSQHGQIALYRRASWLRSLFTEEP
jgi:hypothetical protein